MPTTQPYVTITTSAGVASRFLLAPGTSIHRDPISGQSQVTTVGDASRRGDSRTPEVIFTTGEDGMGEFEYQELESIASYTQSLCDTRHPGMITLPPASSALTGSCTSASMSNPIMVEYLGVGTIKCLAWRFGGLAYYYNTNAGGSWTSAVDDVTGFTKFGSTYVMTKGTGTSGVYTSTDGTTWTPQATGFDAWGCCRHDNKFYVYNGSTSALNWNANPTSTSYTAGTAVLKHLPGEVVFQLFEWQARGVARVFLLTNYRLLWYDEDADAFITYDESWANLVRSDILQPRACVWGRNGDLYVTFWNYVNRSFEANVMHYGGGRELTGPNRRGGLPETSRVALTHGVAATNWLFFFGAAPYGLSSTVGGRTTVMTENGAFHTMYAGTPSTATCFGGGYGNGTLWTVTSDKVVHEQPVPDLPDSPLFTYGDGVVTYPTTLTSAEPTYWHEYAWTDAGSPNMPKQALWLTLDMRDISSTTKKSGMAPGTGVVVQYMTNTSGVWKYPDGATSYTSATHLYTSANPTTAVVYPVVIPLSSGFGVSFKQIKIRVGLATTSAANTPVLASTALALVRQEQPRYAYSFQIDLTDLSHPFYAGKDRFQLLALLDGYVASGSIVKLEFAGAEWSAGSDPAGGRTIANGTFTFGGIEDAATGAGKYNCQILDLTPPSSG